MAISLPKFTNWLWGVRAKSSEPPAAGATPFPDSGFREPNSVKFLQPGPCQRWERPGKIKKRGKNRKEQTVDKEYDMVIVPSDGEYLSGSESDDSDWSIGWLEPHAPEFANASEGEWEASFAVLVPCYGRGRSEQPKSPKNVFPGTGKRLDDRLTDGKAYVEQWLSTL